MTDDNSKRSAHEGVDISAKNACAALRLTLLLLAALITAASFLPAARLWGLNHMAYYSMKARLIALAVMLLSFAPPIARFIYEYALKITGPFMKNGRKAFLFTLLLSAAAAAFMGTVRIKEPVLSEGEFLNALADTASHVPIPGLAPAGQVLASEHKAPGTLLLYYMFSSAAHAAKGSGLAGGAILLSVLLLGALILILVHFARVFSFKAPLLLLFLILPVFSGLLVLFAGYLSKYTPFLIAGTLYALSSYRLIRRKGTIVGPSIFAALSLLFHSFGVLLLPSFFFLLLRQFGEKNFGGKFRFITPALVIVTIAAAAAGPAVEKLKDHYMPLTGTDSAVGIISGGHMIDIINMLFLILPALPLLLSIPLLNRRMASGLSGTSGFEGSIETNTGIAAGEPERGNESGSIKRGPAKKEAALAVERDFALLLFVPWLLFLLLFKPHFSVARNWDLFALAALAVYPLMITGLKRFVLLLNVSSPPRASEFASFVSPALVISIVMSASWLGINIIHDKSLSRFENILAFEKATAAEGFQRLAFFYAGENRMIKAIEANEKSIHIDPKPFYYTNMAYLQISTGDSLSAIGWLKRGLDKYPDYSDGRHDLVTLLDASSRFDELIGVCRAGIDAEPDESQYYYFLGKSYLYTGDTKNGVRALLKCRDLGPPPNVLNRVENLLGRLHRRK